MKDRKKSEVLEFIRNSPGASVSEISMGTGFPISMVENAVLTLLGNGDIMTDGMKKDGFLGDKVHSFRVPASGSESHF